MFTILFLGHLVLGPAVGPGHDLLQRLGVCGERVGLEAAPDGGYQPAAAGKRFVVVSAVFFFEVMVVVLEIDIWVGN